MFDLGDDANERKEMTVRVCTRVGLGFLFRRPEGSGCRSGWRWGSERSGSRPGPGDSDSYSSDDLEKGHMYARGELKESI